MANKLLIRLYNVGLGDCIYVRIPADSNATDDFHILIDCGTLGEQTSIETAIKDLEANMLPKIGNTNKRRLDLLVATHPHKDHIIGFDPKAFQNIQIGHIWLSPIMDPNHPQAVDTHNLQAFAAQAVRGIVEKGIALGPELALLTSLYGLDREGAETALRQKIPLNNGIEPQFVHAGQTSADLGLALPQATITVLGPEENIDYFYLGVDGAADFQGLQAFAKAFAPQGSGKKTPQPQNISAQDFQVLRSRMLSDALAFTNLSNQVENNASVVLLLEWKGKRLLFVGDAEWDEKFKKGKRNAAWNVMWNQRKALLNKPVDFLKIGHHGSVNATPWLATAPKTHEVNQILNAILPLPINNATPKARAVVSTFRRNYKVIPDADLLVELGKRVQTRRKYQSELGRSFNFAGEINYYEEKEAANLDKMQPFRTDFESLLTPNAGKFFIDLEIA